jgi:hypothetical protein
MKKEMMMMNKRGEEENGLFYVNMQALPGKTDEVNIASRLSYVRFEVFTAVTMKNCVFWDVTLCGSCKNRRLGRT